MLTSSVLQDVLMFLHYENASIAFVTLVEKKLVLYILNTNAFVYECGFVYGH